MEKKKITDRPIGVRRSVDRIYYWATDDCGMMSHSKLSFVRGFMRRRKKKFFILDETT